MNEGRTKKESRILKIENRILERANNEQRDRLYEALIYNSAQTFWSMALHYKLCTKEEYDEAQKYYGELWNYVGD